jgi:protein TonB
LASEKTAIASSSANTATQPAASRTTDTPTPSGQASESARQRWQAALAVKLRQLKRYPLAARSLGQEGVVILSLQVTTEGSLAHLEIVRGSGHGLLDGEARRLVSEAVAATHKTFRPGLEITVEVPVVYRLQEG